jgi:hypothetical protein
MWRLEWVGDVVGMDQERRVKEIFESESEGSRRRGRPRLRWLKDIEKNLREEIFKRWQPKAAERDEWVFVLK